MVLSEEVRTLLEESERPSERPRMPSSGVGCGEGGIVKGGVTRFNLERLERGEGQRLTNGSGVLGSIVRDWTRHQRRCSGLASGRPCFPRGVLCFGVALGLLVLPMAAQERHSTILISRRLHDVAWVAGGTALSLTLKEVGVRPALAGVLGSVGLAAAKALWHCVQWCQGHGLRADRMLKDGVWEVVTGVGPYMILTLGKRHPWRGVSVGLGWGLVVWRLDRAQWGRP